MKITLLRIPVLISFLTLSVNLIAQPIIQWDKTIGGSGADQLTKTIPTADGGYLLGGSSNSAVSGDKTQPGKGSLDFWIVKMGADGTKQWDKTFGAPLNDILVDIRQTRDGGYILAGNSDSDTGGDKSESKRGDTDYWMVKIDKNGEKEWDKTLGGSLGEGLKAVRQTPDGGYLMAGTSRSGTSGDKSRKRIHSDRFWTDLWLVKVTPDGKLEWEKTIGSTEFGNMTCFELTSDGGYIAGYDQGFVEEVGGKFYVIKFDKNNQTQWEKLYGLDYSEISTIVPASDGGYILGGFASTTEGGSPFERIYGKDVFIVKIDSSGIEEWKKVYGSVDVYGQEQSIESVSSIVQAPDGGYLVSSFSSGKASIAKIEDSRGGQDFWIFRLDADGNMLWDKTIGGTGNDLLQSAILVEDEGLLLSGYSGSSKGGEKTKDSADNDFWIVKTGPEFPEQPGILTRFTAAKEEIAAQLSWTVARAKGTDHFEIEQSIDRKSWTLIAAVKANEATRTYSYTHTDPLVGIEVRYRIKTVSSDQKTIYSKFRSVVIAAKNPEIAWDASVASDFGYVDFTSIIKTADGGALVTGVLEPEESSIPDQAKRYYDYWVAKISADGIKQWEKHYGGPGYDYLKSAVQTPDGGYLLGGSSNSQSGGEKSEDNKSEESNGYLPYDMWIIKIDASGAKQWDKTLGGNKGEQLLKIIPDSDGNYIVVGGSDSDIGGDKTVPPTENLWFVKIDGNGKIRGDKGIQKYDETLLLDLTTDGGFITTVNARAFENYDKFIITKYSSDLITEWERVFEDDFSNIVSVQQTTDGGYIVGGNSYYNFQSEQESPDTSGKFGYKLLKLKPDGSTEWKKTYGNQSSSLESAIQTSDGGYVLGGDSYAGMEWDKTENSRGEADYWIVKLDKNGSKMWDKTLGGTSYEEFNSLFETADGGYMLQGVTMSEISGERTSPYLGYRSIWLVRLNSLSPPLPVTLLDFSAQKENTTSLLTWNTSSEIHSDRFEVQHSRDGKSWNLLGTVHAKGESQESVYYQYIHSNPGLGAENLYRLKMIDTDGTFTYSKLASLTFPQDISITVFPNPAAEFLTLQAADWTKVKSMEMLNSQGKSVCRSGRNVPQGIVTTKLTTGLYFVNITLYDGSVLTKKVLISK